MTYDPSLSVHCTGAERSFVQGSHVLAMAPHPRLDGVREDTGQFCRDTFHCGFS
jgi:hypothetical protein